MQDGSRRPGAFRGSESGNSFKRLTAWLASVRRIFADIIWAAAVVGRAELR